MRSNVLLQHALPHALQRDALPIHLVLQSMMLLGPVALGGPPQPMRLLDDRDINGLQDRGHDQLLEQDPGHAHALVSAAQVGGRKEKRDLPRGPLKGDARACRIGPPLTTASASALLTTRPSHDCS